MSKGKFHPFLINILQETEYAEVASVEKYPKDWNPLGEIKKLEPFFDWFMNCITFENCLTSDEVALYQDLKLNNKLTPSEELDEHLSEYFSVESNTPLDIDLQFSISEVEKELQNLQSLEDFLKKKEKNEKAVDELDPFIKIEIKELEALNHQFNEMLTKYLNVWDDLKNHLSEEHSVDLCLNKYLNMIHLNNQINKNVNVYLQSDFKEIKPTEGNINVTSLDYWLINQKLSEVEREIVHSTAEMHGKSMIMNHLTSLKHIISVNPQETSLLDIQKFLDEISSPSEKLSGLLSTILEDDVNCFVKLHLNDTKKCAGFLEDRFNRLTRIEYILQTKRILNETLKFIFKRDEVTRDFQLNTLNQFSKNIELLAIQHDQRIENMKNHTNVNKINSLDPNYKAMMKHLGVQNSDYKTLSSEIMNFKENLCIMFADVVEDMHLFQQRFAESLGEIKKKDYSLINGSTREMFGNYLFREFIADLKDNLKTQEKLWETFTKVEEMIKTVKSSRRKKDCIWQKILKNPKGFIRELYEMEKETECLKERVRMEVMNK